MHLETGSSFGHVSSLLVFDPPDDPSYDTYGTYLAQLESRLPLLEPLRRRLVEVPLDLDHPYWINDPGFDLDHHVNHIAVPPPGDRIQVSALVSRIIGRPLDRARPLWEVYVIEGLEGGRFGVLTKVHH
ncbi:MAG: wax ester/triacylglycerol synthase domain-containing protein, partial [Acidimicrobiales bacterium]